MSTTPFLKMTLLTVGQATPETTANDALQRLENATQRKLDVTMSGGSAVVLTADQFTTYGYFNCVGVTAAGTLTVPLTVDGNLTAINRLFMVRNNGSFTLTVTSTGGNDALLLANEVALLFCDGTDITKLLTGAGQIGNSKNVITNSGGNLTGEDPIYDITPFFGGKPTASGGLMGRMVIGRNLTFASGAVGWQAYAGTPATDATATIDIRKNNSSIGSVVFATGSNTATFTFNNLVSFSAGDRLEFFGPATQDTALSDISICMKGVRVI